MLDRDSAVRPDSQPTNETAESFGDILSQYEQATSRKPEERGQLVVFEGVDGSGKTVQCDLTVKWLKKHGFPVIETKWNSSPIISPSIKKAKKTRELSPVLYHLLHSADIGTRTARAHSSGHATTSARPAEETKRTSTEVSAATAAPASSATT